MRDDRPTPGDAWPYAPLLPPALTLWDDVPRARERGPLLPPFTGGAGEEGRTLTVAATRSSALDPPEDTGLAPPVTSPLFADADGTAEEGFVAAAEAVNEAGTTATPFERGPEEAEALPTASSAGMLSAFAENGGEDAAAAVRLADRLEELARELREHGEAALHSRLTRGRRLDALIAAVLAGFLAADREV